MRVSCIHYSYSSTVAILSGVPSPRDITPEILDWVSRWAQTESKGKVQKVFLSEGRVRATYAFKIQGCMVYKLEYRLSECSLYLKKGTPTGVDFLEEIPDED